MSVEELDQAVLSRTQVVGTTMRPSVAHFGRGDSILLDQTRNNIRK